MTTGMPPCELLMNCRLQSRFAVLHYDTMISGTVAHKQRLQGATPNANKLHIEFKIGDAVFAEDFIPLNQR